MAIDAGVVRRLERLAALRLDDSERERLAADLARVVDYVGQLGGLDGVPAAAATAGAAGTTAAAAAAGAAGATAGGADWRPDGAGTLTLGPAAPRRADEPRPCLPRAEALAQAPEASGGHFRVPPVFGGREGRADVAGPAPPAAGPPPEEPPPGALRSSEPPPAGRSPEARAPLAPASELLSLTALGAARLLRRGEVSAAELDRALREAIAARDGSLRAYVWLADPAADPAGASEAPPTGPPPPLAERPLWGLGGALKANLMSAGHPADCGSRLLAPLRGLYDAEVVARLRAAGAHVVGKTNMDEFAMGSSTEHSAHGPTRNPWDLERVPGGSSGGAAAAVAADLAWFALGSDTGGSARQPAHCCGLVGLKPTYGRVSRRGLVAFASSLDQVGPLAKDVADCAAVYAAVAGHDPGDSTSLDAPVGDPLAAVERSPRGLAVGAPRALLETGLAPDVAADFAACLDDLQAQGVTVVDVGLPALPYAVAAYCVLATAEASANLARYDGARYGARAAGCDYAAMAAATRAAGFGPEVKRRILLGAYVLSAGYYDAYYRRALAARGRLGADFARAFAVCDAVALPTAPTAAFRLGERTGDPLRMYLSDVFTTAANLTGLPAVTVPTGLDRDGLPLSLQLIGPALREETLLTLAAAVERARGFRARKEAAWMSRR